MTTLPETKACKVNIENEWLTISFNQPEKRNALTSELTDDIKMFMKYPTLSSLDGFDEKDETESTLRMMQNCVDEIHFGDDVYRRVDMSDKELSEFFNDMTSEMFARVQVFFTTMPKLRHILDIKNPKTKKKSEHMLEGLADFFI